MHHSATFVFHAYQYCTCNQAAEAINNFPLKLVPHYGVMQLARSFSVHYACVQPAYEYDRIYGVDAKNAFASRRSDTGSGQ